MATVVGKNWESQKQVLDDAQGRKAKGNSLFGEGKFDEAAEQYSNALIEIEKLHVTSTPSGLNEAFSRPQVISLMATIRSNLAACHQAKGQHLQAEAEAQAALELNPLYTKAYAKVCKAMFALERFAEAAEAMAVTVALMLPGTLDNSMLSMYKELVVLSASMDFKLPRDSSSIECVASDNELRIALMRGMSVVVIKPGSYIGSLGRLNLDGYVALIGIGKVDITNGAFGHPLYVHAGEVYACHLNVVGRIMTSAVCVASADASLTLVDCVVQEHRDAGVLVIEGHANIKRCTFVNLAKRAVEVREGGSAELRECHIRKCHQGVVANGGARRLEITNCKIEDIALEGVLVNGENPNAATRAQREFNNDLANLSPVSRAASEWAQRTGILLEVFISSSIVKGSQSYGLSLDQGAHVTIVNSVLADNAPAACYVKGATTVLMAGCHIETCNKNCSGLYVAVNYGATVTASGNTFIGPDCNNAIVEEMSSKFKLIPARNVQDMKNRLGLWSKPVIDRNNQIFVSKKGASKNRDSTSEFPSPKTPTLEELAARDIQKRVTTYPIHSKDACTSDYALARTSRCVCHDLNKKPLFYAVGNTFGYDLSMGQNLGAEEPNEELTIRILLGACGDIRNLLKTVSSLQPPLSPVSTVQVRVQVMLHDQNVAILARDVLLLYLIADRTSAIDVVAIWANHALTSAQRKLLDDALMTLAESLPEWLVLPAEPGCNLGVELMEAFAAWRDCTMSLKELLNLRYESVTSNTTVLESAVKLAGNAVGHIRFEKQIRRHITSGNVGNTTKEIQSANPTLLEAPSLQYLLYWSSSIYRAVKLDVSSSTHSNVELSELLLQAIRPQIEAVTESFERGSLEVAVTAGDVLEGMLFGGFLRLLRQMNGHDPQSSSSLFDFIDFTNVADYVSMPAVVQAAVPLLKVVKHATIHAQSMQWCRPSMGFNTKEPLAFLRSAIGMDLETYQELLGITVQAQVVGSSNDLVLQTQWKWKLSATSTETWLTGAMVLLEIMSAAKLHCTSDRVGCITNGKIGGAARNLMSGTLAGLENSSPLTMLHLLFLRCPSILMPIVRVLVATNESAYNTRKWELMGHAMFQRDPVFSLTTFVKATFQANVNFYTLLACGEMPLCLTVSKVPLALGDVASTDVLQVLDAIAYFGECDRVEVMLQRALTENPKCSSYFLTLCAVAHGTTLQAVGHSVPWSFTTQPLTQEFGSPLLPIWTACDGLPKRQLLSDDLELIELIAKLQCSRGKDIPVQSSWTTHNVLETNKYLIVQILLPRPFPGADEAAIAISSSGASLTITTKSVVKKKKSSAGKHSSVSGFPEKHVITLPMAVASDGHNTKVSRNLGIMIVRLPKLNLTLHEM